jgi:hypothetical protein
MNSPDQPIPKTITKITALFVMVVSLPWVFIFDYFSDIVRGFLACGSSIVIISLVISYWNFRNRIWFWSCVSVFIFAHIAMVILVGEVKFQYTAFMIPIFLVDFVAMSFAIGAVADRAS